MLPSKFKFKITHGSNTIRECIKQRDGTYFITEWELYGITSGYIQHELRENLWTLIPEAKVQEEYI